MQHANNLPYTVWIVGHRNRTWAGLHLRMGFGNETTSWSTCSLTISGLDAPSTKYQTLKCLLEGREKEGKSRIEPSS